MLAEQAGWDGIFTWEAAYGVDPWSVLAAVAARTSRVRLGTMRRIPLWVVGVWPGRKSMLRVLRCDGVIPQYRLAGRTAEPDDARAVRTWLTRHGRGPGFDVIADGKTPADDRARAQMEVVGWQQAGCTWWLETRWGVQEDLTDRIGAMRDRLKAGPPGPSDQ